MKNNLINSTLIVGAFFLSNVSIAQKINETNAAVAYLNRYQPSLNSFLSGNSTDLSDAKKALVEAKKNIDLAATNDETKGNQKTLYYKGLIYFGIPFVGGLSNDTTFASSAGDDAIDVAIASLKSAYAIKGKLNSDIKEEIEKNHGMFDFASSTLYKEEKFKEAAESFAMEVKLLDAINEIDTNSLFNSTLCYEKIGEYDKSAKNYEKLGELGYKGAYNSPSFMYIFASTSYRKIKQYDAAKAVVAKGRAKSPDDKDLLLESVNIFLDMNDHVGAEAVLTEAVAKDPKNKILHYQIGTIYMELKQNDKAEVELQEALKIDPNFGEALHQLGVLYVNSAVDVNEKLNNLKVNDPKVKVMEEQAKEYFTKAIVPLEKYIESNPKDVEVLTTLAQVNRFLGNTEKSAEYKKRVAEAKQ